MDDRWHGEGLLKLNESVEAGKGKRKTISSYVKKAMNIEVYNVRGTGVRNAYHLSVGMATASKVGKEVKRAALSQEPLTGMAKRMKVATVFAESTCRDLVKHDMWQYYCTMRLCFMHVEVWVSGVKPDIFFFCQKNIDLCFWCEFCAGEMQQNSIASD